MTERLAQYHGVRCDSAAGTVSHQQIVVPWAHWSGPGNAEMNERGPALQGADYLLGERERNKPAGQGTSNAAADLSIRCGGHRSDSRGGGEISWKCCGLGCVGLDMTCQVGGTVCGCAHGVKECSLGEQGVGQGRKAFTCASPGRLHLVLELTGWHQSSAGDPSGALVAAWEAKG